jgi:hypothetical protein
MLMAISFKDIHSTIIIIIIIMNFIVECVCDTSVNSNCPI